MRWPAVWVCTLSLPLMACPEVHRMGGLADRASHQDALERIPERCSEEQREEFCGQGEEDTEACLRRCGE